MTRSTKTSSPIDALDLVEIKPGLSFSRTILQSMLPDTETALFFGKVYELDYTQLSNLLATVLKSDVASAFLHEGRDHSTTLQSYILETYDDGVAQGWMPTNVTKGDITFDPVVPTGEFLPEVWKSLEVEVAQSIKDVAAKLENVIGLMPGKQGSMIFKSMLALNRQRPTLGTHRAAIHHAPVKNNLVILDVSGSMSEGTVRRIIDDVIALSYNANAHMAVVSNTATTWEPGSYGSDDVIRASEFGGTHYETLVPLLNQDWGTVITIADYDSSHSAKQACAKGRGHIDTLLDISLVNQPTFLAACVGQLADEVRPLLIAQSYYVMTE